LGFWVKGLGFKVKGLGFTVKGLGFEVKGLGFKVKGLGFRVGGLACRIYGLGFRFEVWGSEFFDTLFSSTQKCARSTSSSSACSVNSTAKESQQPVHHSVYDTN